MHEMPVIPENAPFRPEQRLWLNGFLAGYFSRLAVPTVALSAPAPPQASRPLLILFGSQTGNAQALALRFGKLASTKGFLSRVQDAADYHKIDWPAQPILLIVTSTYGEGDVPDNAQPFWHWLQTPDAAAALAHIHYAVLGLGDRTYADFCAAAKKIDAGLEQAGARRIFLRTECDVDYEAEANAWIEGALNAALEDSPNPSPSAVKLEVLPSQSPATNGHSAAVVVEPGYSKTNPFPAPLLKNLCLNKAGSCKEVRHYELSLEGSGLTYQAGDALAVLPSNCPALVNQLLDALHCTGDEIVSVKGVQGSLRSTLTSRLDITKPSKPLLTEIVQRSTSSELKPLLSPERARELNQWLWGRDIVDLLQLLPSPFGSQEFVLLLKVLAPRLYSISSSPKACPGQVHLTVNTVRYESHGRKRKGVASTFLADRIDTHSPVRLFVQPSHGFKLPQKSDVPIIMVGPGTGIAPFRAFLQDRQAIGATGRNWLFFGDQTQSADFLYQDELTAWLKDGHLTRLEVAFSRDQVEKIYVQNRLLEKSAEVWAWLQDGAHFYVCGDASRMAKDVHSALHTIAETAGGLTPDAAIEFVNQLKAEKRYQRDVY